MRFAAALGLFVAIATALCPLRTCFEADRGTRAPLPGGHGHEGHDGPDRDSGGCCTDVPDEAGAPWAVACLDVPCARWASPPRGPRAPSTSAQPRAPSPAPLRSTVLLR